MTANMRKRSSFILAGIAALALIVILGLWGKNAGAEKGEENYLRPVAVALVERTSISDTVTLSGEFRPFQDVDVHAKVAGYIRKIYVDVGDHVKVGQTIAVLEVPELAAQLSGADAGVRAAEQQIHRAQGDVQRAQSSHSAAHSAYARLKQAADSRSGLVAQQEVDDS